MAVIDSILGKNRVLDNIFILCADGDSSFTAIYPY